MSRAKAKKTLPELVRRCEATEVTERHFMGKPFQYGRCDCVLMAAFHLKRFGWKLPKFERYRTVEEGRQRIASLGCETLADLLDMVGLQRIAPSRVLTGDLCFTLADNPIGALCLAIGNGGLRGFLEEHDGMVAMRASLITAAWQVVRD